MGTSEITLAARFALEYCWNYMSQSATSKAAALMGKKGGKQAAKKLRAGKTRKQLAETMRAVANARWHPPAPPDDLEAAS